MGGARDCVNLQVPNVLRDRLSSHRLHPRQPFYEIIEEALEFWESCGGWAPHGPAPVDGLGSALAAPVNP